MCDGGVLVYSHTALAVAFEPPANASYVPASYTIQVATAASFPAGDPSTRTVVVSAATSAAGPVTLPSPFPSPHLRPVFVCPVAYSPSLSSLSLSCGLLASFVCVY